MGQRLTDKIYFLYCHPLVRYYKATYPDFTWEFIALNIESDLWFDHQLDIDINPALLEKLFYLEQNDKN